MPEFIVTDPTGKEHIVSAPEGATQEQVLSYAQSQFSKPTEKPAGRRLLNAAFAGSLKGGPIGAVLGAASEGTTAGSEALAKWAYEAGGKVTDVTGSPELGFAANVGIQAVPTVLTGNMAKSASGLLEGPAKNLMQRAAKPILADLETGAAAKAIQTMLDEGINVTQGGMLKLRAKIKDLNDEAYKLVASSPSTINKYDVWQSVKQALEKFTKQANPEADASAIQQAWHEFLRHPSIGSATNVPVKIAQDIKQGTYQVLKGKYGEQGSASTEAQKAIAHGLKEGIEGAIPEIIKTNAQLSKLYNVLDVAERRAMMQLNNNPGGMALLASNPALLLAFMADKSSPFKSIVSHMIYAGREQIPATAARAGTAMVTGAQNE